jgi:hypothetical protein
MGSVYDTYKSTVLLTFAGGEAGIDGDSCKVLVVLVTDDDNSGGVFGVLYIIS